MNKRIRKLAEQAELSHMPSNYPDMADLYKGADYELEKFAELIIKECADTVLGFHNQFGDSAHNEIKQHFGVEP
jgi:hypothetical protein